MENTFDFFDVKRALERILNELEFGSLERAEMLAENALVDVQKHLAQGS